MTRFEQIATAFPLHAQRIAEATWEQNGSTRGFARLFAASDSFDLEHGADAILQGVFTWSKTTGATCAKVPRRECH